MAEKTYTVLSPLNHDGKPYAPGASIELDPAAARPLVEVGTIAEPNQRREATGDSPEATGAAALQADSAPEPSNDAAADQNATTDRGESPMTEGAAGVPAAPLAQARAPVVPIGTKGGKGKKPRDAV